MRQGSGRSLAWLLIVLAVSVPAIAGPDDGGAGAGTAKELGPFGGPNSVRGQLKHDEKSRKSILETEIEQWLKPYSDFKQRLQARHGLDFGIDYSVLLQAAPASPGEEFAAGGMLRVYGRWKILGRGSPNNGSVVFRVENAHRLGTDIAPEDLGFEVGYAGLTTRVFGDEGWGLTNLFWLQSLLDGRLVFIAGIVDAFDYVDAYSLVSPWTDFSNVAFLAPTIPIPDQGLGAAVGARIGEHIYVLGGIADRNGDPGDPAESFESFFDTSELFTHLEIGRVASHNRPFDDNIHLTAWHADARMEAQVSSGWGLAFSWNRRFENSWEPFVRAGYSDGGGALWEASVSIGVGYHLRHKSDLIALGLSWGRPAAEVFGPGLGDQYTVELYYRLQLLPHLTVTPDLQLLVDPALNPDEDIIAVFGLRVRLDF